ncbi:MAG: hypothetical protein ACREUW_12690 [Burkholderiales bacterium]
MTALLPEILAQRLTPSGRAEYDLSLPADVFAFAGHFPGLPILPGVVQLHWAIHFGARHFEWPGPFTAVEQLKFLAAVRPQDRLTLSLSWDEARARLQFEYCGGRKKVSRGQVIFSRP